MKSFSFELRKTAIFIDKTACLKCTDVKQDYHGESLEITITVPLNILKKVLIARRKWC